jgi:CRP/FNR family transcriptional regulator, anaerobic regulatory protein
MMKPNSEEKFLEIFPYFRNASSPVVREIVSKSQYKAVPNNMMLQMEGLPCDRIGFVLSGGKRVFKTSETGREITIYEIEPGEICILNAACIVANTVYPANIVTLSPVEMLILSAKEFRGMIANFDELRSFTFQLISQNFSAIIELIEEIVFRKMDERLTEYLIEKSENGKLKTTHQKIASDLGTAREVVTRLLGDFEKKGLVHLSKNLIRLTSL